MLMTYSVTIQDKMGKKVGELPMATATDVVTLINKGFIVINNYTGTPLSINEVQSTIGVPECIIGENNL